jgi:hypothetical protein
MASKLVADLLLLPARKSSTNLSVPNGVPAITGLLCEGRRPQPSLLSPCRGLIYALHVWRPVSCQVRHSTVCRCNGSSRDRRRRFRLPSGRSARDVRARGVRRWPSARGHSYRCDGGSYSRGGGHGGGAPYSWGGMSELMTLVSDQVGGREEAAAVVAGSERFG